MVYLDKIHMCLSYLYIYIFKSSTFVFLLFAFVCVSRNNIETLHIAKKNCELLYVLLTQIFKLLKKANQFFFLFLFFFFFSFFAYFPPHVPTWFL